MEPSHGTVCPALVGPQPRILLLWRFKVLSIFHRETFFIAWWAIIGIFSIFWAIVVRYYAEIVGNGRYNNVSYV